jgi:hypothetical protein
MSSAMLWIDKYCPENPLDHVGNAAYLLIEELAKRWAFRPITLRTVAAENGSTTIFRRFAEMEKDGLWKSEQEPRDMLICQLIWVKTAIYYLAGIIGILALGFVCLIRDFYPDVAIAGITIIGLGAAVEALRQQRKANFIEKELNEQVYETERWND